jgi:3-oxoacyl-(acyl-carrier-protein) synthase
VRYELLGWLSHRSEGTPSPFDRRRDGLVVGEGAVCFILEELEHARARGAHILGEIRGYAAAWEPCDPREYSSRGGEFAMAGAVRDAHIEPSEVNVVFAHGLGLKETDAAEARAVRGVFGEAADGVPVTAIKPVTGHVSAAAGGLELAGACLAMSEGVIPPTANLEEPDAELQIDVVQGDARAATISHAVINTFSFGGQGSALVLSSLDE